MLTLQQLAAKGETIITELGALRDKRAEAGDDAAKTVAADAISAKEQEWEALKVDMTAAKADVERRALLADIKGAAVVVPAGGVAADPTVPAQAVDHLADERAKIEATYDYICGKSLSGAMRDALKPTSEKFKQGAVGVSLPRSIVNSIFGKVFDDALYGKENPLLSSGTGQGEGALIPQEYKPELLALPGEPAHILQMATVVPTKTGTLTYPRLVQTDANEYGGVSFTWLAEGAAKPETKPQFEQVDTDAHELAGHTEISIRMLSRSAISLEALLASLYRDAALNILDTVFLTGSGVGQPLGVVNDPGVRSVPRVAAGTVGYQDFVNVKHLLLTHHRPGARWFMDDTVEAALEGTLDSLGRPIFAPSVANGPYDRVIGYPYQTTERQPNIGVSGDVVYGVWKHYLVALEQEIVIKRSDHAEFVRNVAVFVLYVVVGGRPALPRAFGYLTDIAS